MVLFKLLNERYRAMLDSMLSKHHCFDYRISCEGAGFCAEESGDVKAVVMECPPETEDLSRIKKEMDNQKIPLILLAEHDENLKRLKDIGIEDILTHPIAEKELIHKIRKNLDGYHAKKSFQSIETRYMQVFNHSPFPIWICQTDGRILSANRCMQEMLGFSDGGRQRLRLSDISTDDGIALIQKALENGKYTTTLHLKTQSGDEMSLEVDIVRGGEDEFIFYGLSKPAQETPYEALYRNSKSAIITYRVQNNGEDYIILDLNPSAEAMLSIKRETYIGMSIFDAFPSVGEFGLIEVFRRVSRSGHPELMPVSLYLDGKIYGWFENLVYRDPNGNILAVFDNLTESKIMEYQILYKEKRYRELVDNANSIILTYDKEGNITFFNEFAQHFFGFSACEIIGKNVIGTIVPKVDSDGNSLESIVDDLIQNFRLYENHENENVKKNGERVWVSWTNKPIYDEEGNLYEVISIGNNITSRIQMEEELNETISLLQTTLNIVNGAIFIFDPDTRIIEECNNRVWDIFGYTREELLGKNFKLLHVSDELYNLFGIEIRYSLEKKKPLNTLYKLKHKEGRVFSARIIINEIPNSEKNPDKRRVVEIVYDITEEEKNQNLLIKSRDSYMRLLEEFPTMIWQCDSKASCHYFNKAWLSFTGRRLSQETGNGWADGVHPDDLKRCMETFHSAFEKGQTFTMLYRLRYKDGSYRWISDTGIPFYDAFGKFDGYIGSCSDINDMILTQESLMMNEMRLASLLQIAQTDETDIEKILDMALKEAIRLTSSKMGYIYYYDEKKREFNLGTCSKDSHNECQYREKKICYILDETNLMHETVSRRQPVITNDVVSQSDCVHGNFPIQRHVSIPLFQQKRIIAIAGVVNKEDDYNDSDVRQLILLMDSIWKIIERKENENKLREMNETLSLRVQQELAINREKDIMMIKQSREALMGEMMRNIAHQWRQPLNSIGLIVQNMMSFYEDKTLQEEYFTKKSKKIIELLLSMSQTIDDFRNFFAIDHVLALFDISEQIEKALHLIEYELKTRDIVVNITHQKSIRINGYQNEFAQVIMSLLNNSREAFTLIGKRKGTISISLSERDGICNIEFCDDAGGIEESICDKIFDPYFTTKEKSAGIGLFMSKMIIEKSFLGSIHFSNITDNLNNRIGARFSLSIPLDNDKLNQNNKKREGYL